MQFSERSRFGRSRDELVGSHQRALHPASMHEEAEAAFQAFVDALARKGRARREAFPILRADGSTGYANIVGRCVEIDGRDVVLEVGLQEVEVDEILARRYLRLAPGRYALLTVSDTGVGMDAATKSRIYEPFFTTKEAEGGTGLGLAVVHSIVRGHDGEIVVQSEPGAGTTFSVYLPSAADSLDRDPAPAAALVASPQRHRILLVEDDEEIAGLEAARLERLGYEVTVRGSGREALATFEAHPDAFDLVLTDYAMPGCSGLELARGVKRIRPDLPIVLMSGFSAQLSHRDLEEVGINRYLRKPLLTGDLKRTLAELLAAP